jgi:hypothetical protein
MIDEREIVRRAMERIAPPEPSFERLLRRRDLKGKAGVSTGWWPLSQRIPSRPGEKVRLQPSGCCADTG